MAIDEKWVAEEQTLTEAWPVVEQTDTYVSPVMPPPPVAPPAF
jgi:hypothetical protein